jgi:hypothetical protein
VDEWKFLPYVACPTASLVLHIAYMASMSASRSVSVRVRISRRTYMHKAKPDEERSTASF